MMDEAGVWPLHISVVVFVVGACVITICGVMVTRRAERLASSTGIGQAVMGAVFLGGMTSLSGLITSLTAALEGHPELAVSNAVGGIAVQTTFLAFADIVYRRANLEHSAASETNLVQGALLVALLALAVLGQSAPEMTLLGVHPVSVLLVVAYVFGLRLVSGAHRFPMWQPRMTRHLRPERQEASKSSRNQLVGQWLAFLLLAALVAIAGWLIARAGLSIAAHTGIGEGLMGTLFTGVTTSIPECVIAIAAVRRGALTLAVGDIIGGNTFDVLFLAFSDLLYRGGSIYHAVTANQTFWMALSLLMAAVLLLGLIRREEHGIGNIGFESVLVLVLYFGSVSFQLLA